MVTKAVIRPYRRGDRADVLRIAADTAFFGGPVEAFMDDRRLMQDVFVAYYTDREPEHLWVADVDGVVVGYLSGSVGGSGKRWRQAYLAASALLRLVTGHYLLGGLTWRYFGRLARAAIGDDYPAPDLRAYPAHLHINLSHGYRGHGLGRRLLEACLDQMAGKSVPGIHLDTTNLNTAALGLYARMGFRLLGRRRTRLWEAWMPGVEVENLVYGRCLGGGA